MQPANYKLRIAIEAQRIFRAKKHGMDIVVLEMIKELQRIDHYNDYYILAQKDEDVCLEETSNFKIVYLNSFSYPVWEQMKLAWWVRQNKPDILHCTSNTAPLFVHSRLFLTLHDVIFLENDYFLSKDGGSAYQRFGNFYRSMVVPRAARNAEHIFTVSNFQKGKITDILNIPQDKVGVVYNGVSDMFFQKIAETQNAKVRELYHLPDKYFFFLGNTEPRKNLSGVLKGYCLLFNEYKDSLPGLVIKGISADYLRKKCNEVLALDVMDKIILIGYIEKSHLPAIYQMAEMLLFPSFSEGFGIPIIEAMASGIPVITSNVTSMPEVAGEAALLVNPGSCIELVKAMKMLIKDPEIKAELIEKGKKRAKIFTWQKFTQSIHQKYLNQGI